MACTCVAAWPSSDFKTFALHEQCRKPLQLQTRTVFYNVYKSSTQLKFDGGCDGRLVVINFITCRIWMSTENGEHIKTDD